jgi:anaerobic selenocysteine-containing dehydrogenase
VLLLPARTRYEQEDGGIETTTERRILFSPEIPREVGEARTEWRILRDLALAVRPERAERFGCETGWKIREEIAAVVSFYEGVQNLRAPGDELQYGGPRLFDGGRFATPDGKAHFRTVELPSIERPAGEFEVSTRRGKQFNTLIYQERDPLTGAMRDAVFMNPDDAAALHVMQGDRIALVNDAGRLECRVFLAPIARGNLQVHWPEGNVLLVNDRRDPIGGVPDYNARVRIELLVHGKGQPGPAAA